MSDDMAKPFIKWAGGKRQILEVIDSHVPKKFNRFFEPFIGGGAVFFSLFNKEQKTKWIISDLNSDLILTYVVIRDNVKDLINSLKSHSNKYLKNPSIYYYKTRLSSPTNEIERASRLIFLNKTCFNGLYRVNSSGKFNVPFGKYKNPNILDIENLHKVSSVLQSKNVSIKCQDFETMLKCVNKGDFVYLDPPYHPISPTSNFTSYTDSDFDFSDQERLYAKFKALDKKGVKVLLSNSKSSEILELFDDYSDGIIEVNTNRFINSVSHNRTGHIELLIKNYEDEKK